MRLLWALAIISSAALCADDDWNQILHTAHVRQVNGALLKQNRFFTCLETIARSTAKNTTAKARKQDVVQVDVGVGDGQEIYSWPGAASFASENLPELVGHGLLSTGMFHSFATNLFVFDHGTIRYLGKDTFADRSALHYSYTVPHLESEWGINWLGVRASVEQGGEFWVDASDFTLLRLQVVAGSIPSVLQVRTLSIAIDFQLLSLHNSSMLLPLSSSVTVVDLKGRTYRDNAAYSNCRVFGTESKLATSSENLQQAFARYEAHRSAIPGGKTMNLVLLTPLTFGTVRIGQEITARLETPLKISPQLTAPRDTIVKGRVRRFEMLEDAVDTLSIGLEFDELAWGGNSYSFLANMITMQPLMGVSSAITSSKEATRSTVAGTLLNTQTVSLVPDSLPGVASFFLQGRHELPKGFRMTWETIGPAHQPPHR